MSKVFQAFYTSHATFGLNSVSDREILEVARERNSVNDITGILFRTKSHFLQVLEGDEHAIEDIMASIRRDPRHYDMREWPTQIVDVRSFPDWSMGYGKTEREDTFAFALKHAEPKPVREIIPRLLGLSIEFADPGGAVS